VKKKKMDKKWVGDDARLGGGRKMVHNDREVLLDPYLID
jgi:hypothetical protein